MCHAAFYVFAVPSVLWLDAGMTTFHTGSTPFEDITGELSMNSQQETAVSLPEDSIHESAWQRWLDAVPWFPLSVLASIFAVGHMFNRIVESRFLFGHPDSSPLASILHYNAVTVITGLGVAIYGCCLNRQLQKRIEQREQLGPYTLHELIGSGGMGDVYLAEHQLLKRKCAVKLIRRDKASNRRMLARFEREVKATAQLTHWNTIQVYDYGCTPDGTFYYSMEYLQGLNLRQLVDQYGPLPPGRVIFILRQLCGALHEAAGYGLVHRDIKPSNIFLAERGQLYDVAKLLDFGLVRPASLGTCPIRNVSRQLQGSPRFMCPEQAQGQKPDCRGDLYSLACVAYFLLAGRGPFEDDNPVMLVVAHASVPAPRLSEIGVSVPKDLEDIVMRCLSKKPDDRYQSPRELQDALESCVSAGEWSWKEAEHWWNSRLTRDCVNQPPDVPLNPESGVVAPVASDPDPTLVFENRVGFDRLF